MVWEVDFTQLSHFTKMGGNHQIMPNSPIIGEFLHNLVNSSIFGGIHLFPPFSRFGPPGPPAAAAARRRRAAAGRRRRPRAASATPRGAAARRPSAAARCGGRARPAAAVRRPAAAARRLRRPCAAPCGPRAPPPGRPPAPWEPRALPLLFSSLPFPLPSLLSPEVGYFIRIHLHKYSKE